MDSPAEKDDTKIVHLLQKRFDEEEGAFSIRWAAAKALIDLEKEGSDTILFIANSLVKAHNRGGFDMDIAPFGGSDLYGESLLTLKGVLRRNRGDSATPKVVDALVGAVSGSSGLVAQFLADLALTMVFHGSRPPPHPVLSSFDQLDEKQQMVVRGLANMSDEDWNDIWFSGACRQRGLPGCQADCREYASMAS